MRKTWKRAREKKRGTRKNISVELGLSKHFRSSIITAPHPNRLHPKTVAPFRICGFFFAGISFCYRHDNFGNTSEKKVKDVIVKENKSRKCLKKWSEKIGRHDKPV